MVDARKLKKKEVEQIKKEQNENYELIGNSGEGSFTKEEVQALLDDLPF